MACGACAGDWTADVATSTGAPAAEAQLPRAAALAPGYWQPQADVLFMTEAPAASLTANELTLTGVPDTMHFVTRGMGTGVVRTGAPSVKTSCPHRRRLGRAKIPVLALAGLSAATCCVCCALVCYAASRLAVGFAPWP